MIKIFGATLTVYFFRLGFQRPLAENKGFRDFSFQIFRQKMRKNRLIRESKSQSHLCIFFSLCGRVLDQKYRGGFGMEFFWDPKSHIPNPGIFGIFFPKKSQIRNPGIFWDFWDWDFFSSGIPKSQKIPNYSRSKIQTFQIF